MAWCGRAQSQFSLLLVNISVKLVETKVWNEDSWNGKYLGIIPKTKDDKVTTCTGYCASQM